MPRERVGEGPLVHSAPQEKNGLWTHKGTHRAKSGCRRTLSFLLKGVDALARTDLAIRYANRAIGFHTSKYVFDESQIAIIHIPRTGGTSLESVLGNLPLDLFVNRGLHRPVSTKCPPGRFRYLTFLRDPVRRVWAYYCMARRGEKENPYAAMSRRGLPYFLDHCWEAKDMACRYLAGNPYEAMSEERFQLAKGNLQEFFFVGLFEELVPDMKRLVGTLGGDPEVIAIPHLRPSFREPLSEDDAELIRSYNSYDLRLYDWFLGSRRRTSAPRPIS
jgi:hypothetical protein